MKQYRILCMLSALLLIGCCDGLTYSQVNWQTVNVKGEYGFCIRHRCEACCKGCTSNEPSCKRCWECIRDDGCMQNSGFACTVLD